VLKAAQIAVLLGLDLDCGPNQWLASHRSEAVRIPGHLCDSLHEKRKCSRYDLVARAGKAERTTVACQQSPMARA
jgi:hypothetical protein